MMQYLDRLSDIAHDRLLRRYDPVFRNLVKAKIKCVDFEKDALGAIAASELADKKFGRLEEELEEYIRDLLVFGFNSKDYDIPVMKEHVMRYVLQNQEIKGCIKKSSSYMMIKTDKLRFLDVTNYLAARTSLGDSNTENTVDVFWSSDGDGLLPFLKPEVEHT